MMRLLAFGSGTPGAYCTFVSFALVMLSGASGPRAGEKELDARQVLDRVDDLFRSQSSHARMTMRVVTEHWERELGLEAWSKGKDKSLVRILSPRKEQGTATLKVGNEIWNWLPKVKRVIKVPSSMMSASWMGSHFTNDDLVKESRMADDYTFRVTFDGERGAEKVVEITCTPKPQAPVEWGRVVVRVRRPDWMPLVVEYFDEEGALARTMTFEQIEELGGRRLPTRMRMTPAAKPKEYTLVSYQQLEFDLPLEDELFSLRQLQK